MPGYAPLAPASSPVADSFPFVQDGPDVQASYSFYPLEVLTGSDPLEFIVYYPYPWNPTSPEYWDEWSMVNTTSRFLDHFTWFEGEWHLVWGEFTDGGHDVLSFLHTTTTAKPHMCSEVEDNVGSSCGNDSNEVSRLSGSKRSREEKKRKTISILQMVIPGVKGKDSMLIDENIRCLRSLKAEAQSLRL
ncbi:uncharacterized protein LOC116024109 [Ipomoea triloba]|uniref:uncharacterized protein LOC116024109 n=1 Tax=Ipomoea triloba TaxID=35885 RepID=UPI00125E81E2|nr:uncharacterized protein LOC116024109 [Ipomoea triloba]